MGCHDQQWLDRLRRFSPLLIGAHRGGRPPAGHVYLKRPRPCAGDETRAASRTLT